MANLMMISYRGHTDDREQSIGCLGCSKGGSKSFLFEIIRKSQKTRRTRVIKVKTKEMKQKIGQFFDNG